MNEPLVSTSKFLSLVIEAGRMFHEGHQFYRSENGVWLTDAVPPQYLHPFEEKT
jgi:RNA:NAD 2'-phosphotransferase (TPT1/KptA family)